tara:strand:+ start:63 stop:482 length:420 start_codon:yes stop_codon:yes gene_type:complete
MATITSRLTLTGTGTTSDVLNIIKEKVLNVTSPAVQVGTTALTTSFATTLDDLNGTKNTNDTYLYIMNTSSGTETVHAQVVATATCSGEGSSATVTQSPLAKLAKGEFAMIPLEAAAHMQFKGSATTAVMEYAFWTKSA